MTYDPTWDKPMPEPESVPGISSGECLKRHGMADMVFGAIDMLGVVTGSYTEDDLIVMVVLMEEALDGTDITRGENGANLATLRMHTEALQARTQDGGITVYPPPEEAP